MDQAHGTMPAKRATGKPVDGPGARSAVLLSGAATGGRFSLVSLDVRRGGEPPRHVHQREDELVYVLAGELTFYVGDEVIGGGANACVVLPRGREHAFRVESGRARLLVFVTPAGLEDFYAEVGGDEGAPSLERLIGVAARYGVDVTGPPPGC